MKCDLGVGLAYMQGFTADTQGLDLTRKTWPQRYNVGVISRTSQDEARKHHRQAVYASETTGLLLIAFLLLALTLIRYWHWIHWSLR